MPVGLLFPPNEVSHAAAQRTIGLERALEALLLADVDGGVPEMWSSEE